MTVARWLAAWLLGVSSALVWAGGRLPCSEAQVFGESAVNLVVLPYRYSGERYGEIRSTASRLSSLLQQEALFSMLRYGSVGATELVAGSAPDACDVRKVIDRVMGPADRPNLRTGHGLVLVWGRIYEEGDEIFVQTYLRFLRRDRSETFEVALPATNAGSLALTAALPAGAVAIAPRRLTRSDVEEVENSARMALLLYSAPDPSAASRPLARSPDEPLAYAVTDAGDGWMKIRSFASGETGWIKARVATASWSLRRFLPELWYLDAVIGYLRLRTSDKVPVPEPAGPAQVKAEMFEAVQSGFRRYEEAVGRDAAPEAASLARSMRGVLLWTNPALAGAGDAQVKSALLFEEAREVLPESSGARALAAVTAPFLKPAPVASKSTMASVNDGLLGAIAVDPGNLRALRNLKQVYRFAGDTPAASPYESAEVQRRLGVVDNALGTAGPRPIVPAPDPKVTPLVTIKVPDLARLPDRQALDFIARAGLNVGRIEPRADAGNVPGTVLGQTPAAGSVAAAGSRVDLVVAVAPPRTDFVVVPGLVQLAEMQAGEVLRKAGLEVGQVTRRADAKAVAGVVLEQKPASGAKALAGSKVDLSISEPVVITAIRVPDVLKRPEREAAEILAKVNLGLGRVERRTDAQSTAGTVLEQSPAAGTTVAAGSKVDLLVTAPQSAELRVPDVIKLNEKEAIDALRKAGLDVGRVTKRLQPEATVSIVLEQVPTPGARATAGTKVDLWVSASPSLGEVLVPELAKMPEKFAVEALNKAGLNIGRIERRVDTKTAAGIVLEQVPMPGARAAAGTKVDLWVSASPSLGEVLVPELAKMPEKLAVEALNKAGLNIGRIERRVDTKTAAGIVLEQVPMPGARAAAGTKVDLWVSASPSLGEVLVPELAKMPEKLAVEALNKAGLNIGRIERRIDTKTAAGTVLEQKPPAAAKVQVGTKVDVLVSASASASTVVVPNVLKRPEKEAQEMLMKAGLEVGRVERRKDSSVAPGMVLDQRPAGDAKVAAKTPVDLVVAAPR